MTQLVQRWASVTAIGTAIAAGRCGAAVIHVDAAVVRPGEGFTWTDAFARLEPALAASRSGDEIRVAEGVYKPSPIVDPTATFDVPSGVRVLGGYAGGGAPDPDARDIAAFATILSGDLNGAPGGADSYHVVTLVDAGPGTLLEGFTIRNGAATAGGSPNDRGAGVRVLGGSPTIASCTIRDTFATEGGSALYSTGAPTLIQCVFVSNLIQNLAEGGVIWSVGGALSATGCQILENDLAFGPAVVEIDGGSVALTDCLFDDTGFTGNGNLAIDDAEIAIAGCVFRDSPEPLSISGASAGVVTNCTFADNLGGVSLTSDETVTFTSCLFENNAAEDGGGAAFVRGPGRFETCSFVGNTAGPSSSQGADGGAIATDNQPLAPGPVFVGCEFRGNTVIPSTAGNTEARGGALSITGSAALVNCRVLGNTGRTGGGIHVTANGIVSLTNVEFSGNNATQRGGAVYSTSGEVELRACTIATNSATLEGGGVHIAGAAPETTIANSILWGNLAAGQATLAAQLRDAGGGEPSVDYTCVQGLPAGGTLGGVANFGLNPLFTNAKGPDNIAGTVDDDLSVQASSPCVDSGENSFMPLDEFDIDGDGVFGEFIPFDVIGAPRFMDAPPPEVGCIPGAVVDRGAHELLGTPGAPLPGDFNGDGVLGGADLAMILSAWGVCPSGCCVEDLTGDGLVNASDLAILLTLEWTR